jgi:alpha-ketoglutarate-dependent 2,4-dichlorophenoxyacetate dioxygenase
MSLHFRPLHPLFAAEVSTVDLRRLDDPETLAEIRDGMDRYGVLVFHDQPFTDQEQIAFASFVDPAGRYSMLNARVLPPAGIGDTEFADMRAAYDALPAEMKATLEGLRVHHSIAHSRQVLGFEFSSEEAEALKGAIHPLIRTIPRSGRKALYVASHASRVIDWPVPEGRLLLRDLIEHATQRDFVYRHGWHVGDLVIWDNRCTMHRATPFDDAKYRRELRRVTTLDIPVPSQAPAHAALAARA